MSRTVEAREGKAAAIPANLSREKNAVVNLFASNQHLFAPLKFVHINNNI